MTKKTKHPQAPHDANDAATHTALEKAVRAQYASLPVSERRIADFILEFPGEVAAYTATELAELSNGSKAAVTRLIKRLGFSNYDEARRAARDAQTWGSPLYLMQKSHQPKDFAGRVQFHIDQDVQNITTTLQSLSPDSFRLIVDTICTADRVVCVGWRNSYFLAAYLHWQIVQVRKDVSLLPTAGMTLAEDIAMLGKDDLLICVGMRRRVPQVEKVIAAANKQQAKILYVTDRTAGALSSATWTIPCSVRGSEPFDRYGAVLSLFHLLSVAVVEKMGETGRKHLQSIEHLHDVIDEME
ncbi:MurR/RpiR family transcriptional regulator [Hwanghaeella grinnelliae]|uniref:MurR/RpiR family transcriptional regulator n=1 Tax=Hwanghaeella grinnelliae TaxID=2500179 RepID=A0A3S2Z4Q4_9PROT|nr:MurR/RpiR family transcriptional regulator [Hwanghaeella grinnelliae]RVU33757.1 MurR/RpiR family transcriptional regulator [Hwanghaeella grinnelliae]